MKNATVVAGLLISLFAVDVANAQDSDEEPTGVHCVNLNRIERIEILDDEKLLFHMKGHELYLNTLPHRCASLDPHDTLMYRASTSQLCSVDVITVLESIGFGFSPGISCGLGKFYPVTEEQAEELKMIGERQRD
jgi:hypothetical protein